MGDAQGQRGAAAARLDAQLYRGSALSLLELEGVGLRWGPEGGPWAVAGVDLTLRAGERVGIVGGSGSGKSSLARAIIHLPAPTRGRVSLEGHDLATLRPAALRQARRRLQLIPQDPLGALDPRTRVGDSVAAPLRAHGLAPRGEIRARVAAYFEEVGLEPALMDRKPRQLSGGQRQRVCIARALACAPSVLILDEPTSALDTRVRLALLALLEGVQAARRLTYLLISHELEVIGRLCQRALVMEAGQIIEAGPVEALLTQPRHPTTRALVNAARLTPAWRGQ
ncbi:ATP-binding cassette domain-containing protein [Myxococcota bacterium]|nr:ATP-binding cassette domain-containing protein [Myxococcota bacterium]MBU1898130.1 ATP-binding cassette domain-containing protein [Myxococcota bacterium]